MSAFAFRLRSNLTWLVALVTIFSPITGCTKKADSAAEKGGTVSSTAGKNPVVIIETSMGNFEVELWQEKAPISVKNFLSYVDDKFYDGTVFHRVIDGFMIQGGGFTEKMDQKPTKEQIKNEAKPELKNVRGTIAMARTQVVDSASSQFFVNVKDNPFLDQRSTSPAEFGYAVFGQVTSGMDVVDKIKAVKTGRKGMFDDVPLTAVVIKSVKRK